MSYALGFKPRNQNVYVVNNSLPAFQSSSVSVVHHHKIGHHGRSHRKSHHAIGHRGGHRIGNHGKGHRVGGHARGLRSKSRH